MKKTDEMDTNIKLRSEELGFKAAVLLLAIWVLYECRQGFFSGGTFNRLPFLILLVTLCIQRFSEMAIKRKMISGDEEYKEPNKLLWGIIMIVAIIAIVLSIGSLILNYK